MTSMRRDTPQHWLGIRRGLREDEAHDLANRRMRGPELINIPIDVAADAQLLLPIFADISAHERDAHYMGGDKEDAPDSGGHKRRRIAVIDGVTQDFHDDLRRGGASAGPPCSNDISVGISTHLRAPCVSFATALGLSSNLLQSSREGRRVVNGATAMPN